MTLFQVILENPGMPYLLRLCIWLLWPNLVDGRGRVALGNIIESVLGVRERGSGGTGNLVLAAVPGRDPVCQELGRVCELGVAVHRLHGYVGRPCERMGDLRASATGASRGVGAWGARNFE